MVIPLLPRASIDDMLTFYEALGFERTYRQTKPNPYLAMRRQEVELHFFGMPNFDPAQSYGSCIIQVPDTGPLHRAFADGLRVAYGKVPLSGIPRMTRPRPRKNSDQRSGFTVVDPGGNWIRIFAAPDPLPVSAVSDLSAASARERRGRLAVALENAVVLADSRGEVAQAAKILDRALARASDASAVERVEALAYRAELALTLDDPARAAAVVAELRDVPLDADERAQVAATLNAVSELSIVSARSIASGASVVGAVGGPPG
ncbi:VOC family protein [Micromonospora sp. NPDC049559]|uniref:bleomycin resistance protein n=1 Tax=Micromonospora sp. NPDC049559 TaxID=3155923 RepID=UPI003423EA88